MRVSVLLSAALVATTSASNSHRRERAAIANEHQRLARSGDVVIVERDLIGDLLGGVNGIISSTVGGLLNGLQFPVSNFQCSGNGLDGFLLDYNKKSCPSSYPDGFKYFGKQIGWGAPLGFNLPAISWTPYSGFASACSRWTWWAPSSSWQYPESQRTSFPLDLWTSLGWHSWRGPAHDWSCNKSGNDGWDYDHQGASCPYAGVSGWKWYGSNGWQPPLGWVVPSVNWVPPTAWVPSLAGWWSPSVQWNCPSSINRPGWWPTAPKTTTTTSRFITTTTTTTTAKPTTTTTTINTTSKTTTTTSAAPTSTAARAPKGYQCDGTGYDGFELDADGNGNPYEGYVGTGNNQWGFMYFGEACGGWQPSEPFNIPYPTWSLPDGVTMEQLTLAPWWIPSSDWYLPGDATLDAIAKVYWWLPTSQYYKPQGCN